MTVTLLEPGLIALLDSPASPVSRYVTLKAEAVAEVARQNVQANFRSRSGTLLASIGTFPSETPDGLEVEVGTDGAPYGRILEVGGEPHPIDAVNRRTLFSEPDNPDPLVKRGLTTVIHPGPAAKPWLKPALETVFGA